MIQCIKSGIKNIFRKKLRSLLTISGVAIGVVSVLIISSIGDIGKYTINQELESVGIGGLALGTDKTVTGKELGARELELIRSQRPVEDAMPLLMQYTGAVTKGNPGKCLVWGISGSAANIISLNVKYGRLVNQSDLNSMANVCVVDESFAQETYKRGNIVGKTITVLLGNGYEEFEVVGVVETGGNVLQSLLGEYVPTFVYLPFTTMQQLTGRTGFDQIAVKLKSDIDPDTASAELVKILEAENKISGSVTVENLNSHKEQLNHILDIVTMVLSVIGGISLVVAGLSIMTVMLVSVHERTREIGIKKSIGASKGAILLEFLAESLFITLLGSLVGTTVGLAVVILGSLAFGLDILLNIRLILFCIGFAVVIGVLFGVYPAMKAANLRPVDALRSE